MLEIDSTEKRELSRTLNGYCDMLDNADDGTRFGLAISGNSLPIIFRNQALSENIAYIFS